MAYKDEIETLFTTWADRNVQASKASAAEKAQALAVADAEIKEVFGTPGTDLTAEGTDFLEDDPILVQYGFYEAVIILRGFVPMKIDGDLSDAIDKYEERKQRIKNSRRQQADKPRNAERDHSNVNGIYPFGKLPWRDKDTNP